MTDKYLLYPADGDIDEDEGMTKEGIMGMLAEELGYTLKEDTLCIRTNLDDWTVAVGDDGRYLYVSREDKPGQIHIKAEDEGYVVDLWTYDGVGDPRCVGSTTATYRELESE